MGDQIEDVLSALSLTTGLSDGLRNAMREAVAELRRLRADQPQKERARGLIARMAGNIAAGLCHQVKPPYTAKDATIVGDTAVRVARAILAAIDGTEGGGE